MAKLERYRGRRGELVWDSVTWSVTIGHGCMAEKKAGVGNDACGRGGERNVLWCS